MSFELHPNLLCKAFIVDLPLCRVLLEDDVNYPWLLLVPRRPNISRIMELQAADQLQLLHEIDMAQHLLWDLFKPDQLNVAAIGNKTPQLHVHVIARKISDPAWPGTVWDKPRTSYSQEQKQKMIAVLVKNFGIQLCCNQNQNHERTQTHAEINSQSISCCLSRNHKAAQGIHLVS